MRHALVLLSGLLLAVNACSWTSSGTGGIAGAAGVAGTAACGCSNDAGSASTSPFHTLALLAGSTGGAGSLDGTGSLAGFNGVIGLASDGAGNLYAADATNETIRKIVVATGEVTTIAGSSGIAGSADGIGRAARFNGPKGVAFDAGNLYVADTDNSVIRKIELSTGFVSTIAGAAGATGANDGSGGAARFARPQGVASDGNGNLYVADTYNDAIRRIVLATATVTTIPGASNGLPDSVVSDGAGNLYVAGFGGTSISKVNIATGVSTALPTGDTFAKNTALAIGGGKLYFADGVAGLYAVDLASGTSSPLAGDANTGPFSTAEGIALDGAGNIYVADGGTQIHKFVLATGAATTIAGSAAQTGKTDGVGGGASFNGPAGLVLDGKGHLYVADEGSSSSPGLELREIAITSGVVTTPEVSVASGSNPYAPSPLQGPTGLARGDNGRIFLTNESNTIGYYDPATGLLTTLAGTWGYGVEEDGAGSDPQEPYGNGLARFNTPAGIVFDGPTSLYVTDLNGPTVRRVNVADGTTTTVAPPRDGGTLDLTADAGGPPGLQGPEGIVTDGAGTLYVADAKSHVIWTVVVATGALSALAGSPGIAGSTDGIGSAARFNAPVGLAADGEGNLYVGDSGNSEIRKVAIGSGTVTTVVGAQGEAGDVFGPIAKARLRSPTWLAYGPGPALYVTDGNAIVVLR
jgi:sugar lactone lactonase YvrE